MEKKEILDEYFLVEVKSESDDVRGWKVLGTVEGGGMNTSLTTRLELKTEEESWLCNFRVKLLWCGLVLASPEYVIDEDETIMEAITRYNETGTTAEDLEKTINEAIKGGLFDRDPYYPHDSWTSASSPATWIPYSYTNNITCSSPGYYSASSTYADSCTSGLVSSAKEYIDSYLNSDSAKC